MKKIFFLLTSFVLIFAACVDQKFDEPELTTETADFKANATIADLKKLHTELGQFKFVKIDKDLIIEGTVIADDASGNFYKTIVIQDATAGIDIKINATGLYNDFPIGSKVLVKCKDLTLSDYNFQYQLGGGIFDNNGKDALAGIEQALIPTYIFKNGKGTITPRIVKLADLTDEMTSTLIQLDNVEFSKSSYTTFADGAKKLTVNRPINDCNAGSILLRTSGYCSFANDVTSEKNGIVIGIYSVFGTDKQLFIRDPSDVRFDKNRCDGTAGGGGTGGTGGSSTELLSIGDLRNSFTGTKTTVAANKYIKGVVISDKDGKNVQALNMVVQGDDGKGIMVRFTAAHSYALGDAVEIDVAGAVLDEYQSNLQVSGVTIAKSKTTGKGILPTPKKFTIADVATGIENLESTLVLIENCAHTATKYGGNIVLDDKSGSKITLYTSNTTALTATFSNDVPVSTVLNVVGIIGQFGTTNQIQMRNLADATKGAGGGTVGGGGGGATTLVSIGSIRNEYLGATTKVSSGKSIKGVVISDKDSKNVSSVLNVVLQGDDGKGIIVRFDKAATFALGESIEVNVGDLELSEFNGGLQINKVPLGNAVSKGTGTLPTPKVMTIADYVLNFENVESTLIQIKDATLTGGKYFDAARGTNNSTKGTLKVTDNTGTIDMYTLAAATFAGETPPSTAVTVTGIAGEFTAIGSPAKGIQISIRNASDVK